MSETRDEIIKETPELAAKLLEYLKGSVCDCGKAEFCEVALVKTLLSGEVMPQFERQAAGIHLFFLYKESAIREETKATIVRYFQERAEIQANIRPGPETGQ